jgi:tetratricopeptide (TPR) repeat protein
MIHARAVLLTLLLAGFLAGCATPYRQGRAALAQGRYEEAVAEFERSLASDPDRLDALVGLGVAKYKVGAFDESIGALTRAVARAPSSATTRLYLALSHLQQGQTGPADEHLRAFLGLGPRARSAAQVERALRLVAADSLSPELRAFIAASLENDAEWERELERIAQAAYPAPGFYPYYYGWPPYYGWGPCFTTWHGRLYCY